MKKKYELIPDIVEDIADMIGIYGVGDGSKDTEDELPTHSDRCNCRICFTIDLNRRIREAITREPKMAFINTFRYEHEN